MTVGRLHKQLTKLIEQGHKRRKVVIDKPTFSHPLESDGCCMLDVKDMSLVCYHILNEHGGFGHGKNDVEKYQTSLVLVGTKLKGSATKH